MGGSDFSSRAYSYCDNGDNDVNLDCFALQTEDLEYKVKLLASSHICNEIITTLLSTIGVCVCIRVQREIKPESFSETDSVRIGRESPKS